MNDAKGGPEALALDLSAHGATAAVTVGGEVAALDLRELGLSPELFTVREGVGPSFAGLAERLDEDAPVEMEGRGPAAAQQHYRDLMEEITGPLRAWWGPLDRLAVLVRGRANQVQRSRLLEGARLAGWQRVRLIHKTMALAWEMLPGNRPGNYLVLALGYGPAEGSVVHWEGLRLRSLACASEQAVSGAELDRHVIRGILGRLGPPGEPPGAREWLRLRRQVELMRLRLGGHPSVSLELPACLTGGPAVEATLERSAWLRGLSAVESRLTELIQRCCREAGARADDLRGCLVTGGLLRQAPVLAWLTRALEGTRLILCPPQAEAIGACRLGACEDAADGLWQEQIADGTAGRSAPGPYRLGGAGEEAARPAPRYSPDAIVEKVRDLAGSGRTAEARTELNSLKAYVRLLELSLEEPAEALQALAKATSAPEPPAAPPAPAEESEAVRQRAERRKYLLGRDYLRQAEGALKEGRLGEAVLLSHKAHEASADSRVFAAMIEVHLRAARRRPAAPAHFAEERRWLLCALKDDRTSESVRTNLSRRYLTHAQQLAAEGAAEARAEAAATLAELVELLPQEDQARRWLRQLREAEAGPVKLVE
jgi:hypothetical protein